MVYGLITKGLYTRDTSPGTNHWKQLTGQTVHCSVFSLRVISLGNCLLVISYLTCVRRTVVVYDHGEIPVYLTSVHSVAYVSFFVVNKR